MNRQVHTFGNDLLGSVLMRLLSAWRLSEKLGAKLTCYWPEETAQRSGFRFGELFERDPPFTLSNEYPNFRGFATLNEALDGITVDLTRLAPEFVYSMTGIALLPGEDMPTARDEARALFSRLTLAKPIRDAIAEIDGAVSLEDVMAVHVRRGSDIIPLLRTGGLRPSLEEGHIRGYARMFVDLESYRIAIRALGSPKCFIFSPDEASRTEIKADIGGYSVDDFPALKNLTSLQRDLAEILIMSRTARVLGPKSNYSGLARLLGDLRLEWVAHWISPDDMIAMIKRDFPGQPDIQARILKATAAWYARLVPTASEHFAFVADQIEPPQSLAGSASL
jgi:hypothetical protein